MVLLNERPGPRLNLTTEAKVMANRWTHLAFTYDGQAARLYIDGQVASIGAHSAPLPPVPGSPLLIAADLRMDFRAPLFPRLDDVRLYDRGPLGRRDRHARARPPVTPAGIRRSRHGRFFGGALQVTNARFSTPPTPETLYTVVRVPVE